MPLAKHKYVIPDNYMEYLQYFHWMQIRNINMLEEYIEGATLRTLWNKYWLSYERVRQCLSKVEYEINEFHKRFSNKNK